MEIKPIHTEADYESALKEIEMLMESQPGNHEGDRMDILVTLVEAYEAKHFPIPEPDDPLEVLEYYLESHTMSNISPKIGSRRV
jgi:HTH-type transcriptional regulator / antitoxin HigA